MNRRVRRFVAILPFLAAAAVSAQELPEVPPQYEEEIEVRVIDIDVVVTDRKGNPITGLTRDDFELYEDGRRVDIAYFSRIAGGLTDGGPVDEALAEPGFAAPAPKRPGLTWIIFIDHTNMEPRVRNEALRQLREFVEGAVESGDQGVIALNDGRTFQIRQNVTGDLKVLLKSLAKIEKERMAPSPTKQQTNALLNQMRRSEADFGAGSSIERALSPDQTEYMAITAGGEISNLIREEAARTKAAILAMGTLLDALAPLRGRLAMVYVGAGFNTLPAANLTEIWRARYAELGPHYSEPRPQDEKVALEREIDQLHHKLGALRVTLYTIHGGDQGGGPTSVEDSGMIESPMEIATGVVALTEAGNARDMAERTGGLYFKVGPGLAERLETARRDFDDYYSLGYRPEGKPGKTHRIDVKVNVDDARVRHRTAVRERTREEEAADTIIAAMVQPQPQRRARKPAFVPVTSDAVAIAANPLGVSVEAVAPERRTDYLPFVFSLQLDSLTFVRHGDTHTARFVMHFAFVGRDGVMYPVESREQSLTVTGSELPTADQYVSHSWHVDVSPLRIPDGVPVRQKGMRLVVSVEDRFSGRRSIVTVPLDAEKDERR